MTTTDTTEAVILTGDAFDLLAFAGGLDLSVPIGGYDNPRGGNPKAWQAVHALHAALTAFSDQLRADGNDEAEYELVVSLRRV